MRKYKYKAPNLWEGRLKPDDKKDILHPDCTRPDDRRPGDLYMPFPDGIPEAVGVHFRHNEEWAESNFGTYRQSEKEKFIEGFNLKVRLHFGPHGIYTKALGGAESFLLLKGKSDRYEGVIFTDTEVDSTVLVNSLQFFNSIDGRSLVRLLEIGLTEKEALIISMLNGFWGDAEDYIPINHTGTYYFSNQVSLRRLIECDPNDLTGGTFRNRFDYNRPDVQHLFKASKNEVALNWHDTFKEVFHELHGMPMVDQKGYKVAWNTTPERFLTTVHEIFKRFYHDNGGYREQTQEVEKAA